MRKPQVLVIGSSEATKEEEKTAYSTGEVIGKSGALLITGGRLGVMEEASRGAKDSGGYVLGILPSFSTQEANPYCDIVIPTGMGWTRNSINVLAGDLVVAIGGAAGTLSEIAYAWLYFKTIFAYTFSGWSKKLASEQYLDSKRQDSIIPLNSIEDFQKEYQNWLNQHKNQFTFFPTSTTS